MKWHQAKCTHQESCICDIRSHVLILCTEHETLKRVTDYAQIIKPSPVAWLVGEIGMRGHRGFLLEVPSHAVMFPPRAANPT